jgi:tetratricopeptide (TPR) repeat protein
MLKRTARIILSAIAMALCTAQAATPLTDIATQLIAAEAAGNSAEAERLATALIHTAEKSDVKGSMLPWALDRLGSLKQDQSRYQEARRLYERSIRLWELRKEQPALGLAHALNNLASLYSDIGQLRNSELLCRRSLSIHIKLQGASDPDVALAYSNLATVLFSDGQFGKAESFANKAVKIWENARPALNRADLAYNTLARLRLHRRRFAEARQYIKTAIRLCKKAEPLDCLHLAEYFQTLGLIDTSSAKFRGASKAFTRAKMLFRRVNAGNSLEYLDTLAEYAAVLRRTGHKREAKQLERDCMHAAEKS